MPSKEQAPIFLDTYELPVYRRERLIELRRSVLLYARSLPLGSERNQQRQVARSLRALFNTPDGSCNEC